MLLLNWVPQNSALVCQGLAWTWTKTIIIITVYDDDQSVLIETSSCNFQFFFRTNYYSIERFSHGVTASCLYFTYLLKTSRVYCSKRQDHISSFQSQHFLHGCTCKFTSNSYFLLSTPCKASNIIYLSSSPCKKLQVLPNNSLLHFTSKVDWRFSTKNVFHGSFKWRMHLGWRHWR